MIVLKRKHEAIVASLNDEIAKLKTRIRDVEDLFEEKNKIKIRNEITNVLCKFNKLEMSVFIAGISLLIKNSKNTSDVKFYLGLLEKIENVMKDMKEGESV